MTGADERKAKGINDDQGKTASPVPPDLDWDAYGQRWEPGLPAWIIGSLERRGHV
jgi:hypothetical protein